MDFNNSDSYEMFLTKMEPDSENETSSKKDSRPHWNSKNTMKLIDTLEKECKELWDTKYPLYKDRNAKQIKLELLAGMFDTTSEEISRKIHNLRTQFNNELRKIKRRQSGSGEGISGGAGGSGWEYFEALSFLRGPTPCDPLDDVEGVNLALAEFQAQEEEAFGAAARARNNNSANNSTPTIRIRSDRPTSRVAVSIAPPLPPSAHPLIWPDDPAPRLRPSIHADECQIFGDFVASELRTLRSQESRKRLKRIIQKAILQIGEEEDINSI